MVAYVLGKYWVNRCGTYGVASAQYFWGRMASLLVRLLYQIDETFLWIFVFVDDFMLIFEEDNGREGAAMFLLFMELVGCPLSWHKTSWIPPMLGWATCLISTVTLPGSLTINSRCFLVVSTTWQKGGHVAMTG